MAYTDSPLIDETCIVSSSLYGSRFGNPISKVTIHHQAGCLTGSQCKAIWESNLAKGKYASANYSVYADGTISLLVPEKYRAFTSSSVENDKVAVTIEVANVKGANYCNDPDKDWVVSNAAYEATIKLVADICQRNNIEELTWTGDKNGTLTVHRFFDNTHCPGNYLYKRMPDIADKVNSILRGELNMTIDEFIELLTPEQAAKIYTKANSYIKDTPATYGEDSLAKAKEKGIYQGDTNGNLMPNSPITRLQFAIVADRMGLLDK